MHVYLSLSLFMYIYIYIYMAGRDPPAAGLPPEHRAAAPLVPLGGEQPDLNKTTN